MPEKINESGMLDAFMDGVGDKGKRYMQAREYTAACHADTPSGQALSLVEMVQALEQKYAHLKNLTGEIIATLNIDRNRTEMRDNPAAIGIFFEHADRWTLQYQQHHAEK
jgi:hypothetical protein